MNAWLVLVTSKPPTWRDPLTLWPEEGPTLGRPHDGFYYPDPMGFWAEVRRWVAVLLEGHGLGLGDELALSALVHLADGPGRLATVLETCRPAVVLYLDQAAWEAAPLPVGPSSTHGMPDPHREGTVYEGWWATADDGVTTVGKAPQHPATHRLYDADALDVFLRARPA